MGALPAIVDGAVALARYDLAVDGRVVEKDATLVYLHGRGNVIAGLEARLAGLCPGERLHATVAPEQAYGAWVPPGPQRVSRREFARKLDIRPGHTFEVERSDGSKTRLWISKVEGAWVWVDNNHPLAGKTLVFDVEVLAVREATWEEAQEGRPHA